ncbi:MAG TPA: hydrolase [Candidatus Saccharimonadales bacterium]
MPTVNHVPTLDISTSLTGCCPLIDPKEWDNKTFEFKDKLFVRAPVRSFLHIPLNMGSVMAKTQAAIDQAGASVKDYLILSDEASAWRSDQYFAVSKNVPGCTMIKLTGTYITKVFEGPYREAPKWYQELLSVAKEAGKEPKKTYFFYTVCPKCAKTYKKNYVVGFVQIA